MSIDTTLTRRMTMAKEVTPERKFVTTLLPWIIAAGALVLYFVTRDAWQTIAGAQMVGIVSGWSYQTDLTRPLYWLVTSPIRLLPDAWVPLGLNIFSLVCGALTLALLARSVALLPHDRTEDQRLREQSPFSILTIRSAWLPPLLAAIACGLQLTFWEQATGISVEMFDLLVFAYVVRCLLEFRFNGADSWLLRAAFVYAAGMTNNWAMVAFAPLFLVSLVWMKGLSFFNAQFLSRLLFVGSAGLCFYLLLPIFSSFSGVSAEGFWAALKGNLLHQKNYIAYFLTNKAVLYQGERPLWVLALPSLLPLLALSIRWPATFGDHSKIGQGLATFTFNVLHAIFLVVCAWTFLDPQFSPRNYNPTLTGPPYNFTMLLFYFLGALCLGYYSGYFLLCFGGAKPLQRLPRVEPPYTPLLNGVVTGGVCMLAIVLSVMLLYSNWGQLHQTSPVLSKYAELKTRALTKGAVVVTDNVLDSILVQAKMIESGTRSDFLVLDTPFMSQPSYHRFLAKRSRGAWRVESNDKEKLESGVTALLSDMARSRDIFYLNPSFGDYFEKFRLQPFGPVLKMIPWGTNANSLLEPPLTPEMVSLNQKFWDEAEVTQIKPLALVLSETNQWDHGTGVLGRLAEKLKLVRNVLRETLPLATSYARALDYWGVQLQRNNMLAEARTCFERSLQLNPENISAGINLLCNENLKAARNPRIDLTADLTERIQKRRSAIELRVPEPQRNSTAVAYYTLVDILNGDGPLDEPSSCWDTATMFFDGRKLRQAAVEYKRITEFHPNDLRSRLRLAESMLLVGAIEKGLEFLSEIHKNADQLGLDRASYPELLRVELVAHLMNNDAQRAEQVVSAALEKYSGDEKLLAMASHVYLSTGNSSNALKMLDGQLARHPDDRGALINLGVAWMRLTNYDNALPALTRVIQMGTNGSPESADSYYRALFNRGLAYDRNNQFELAQKDFEEILKALPNALDVYYALGEMGARKQDNAMAVRNYELWLQKAALLDVPTNSPQLANIVHRLKELKEAKR